MFEQPETLPAASTALAESVVVALEPTVTWIPEPTKAARVPLVEPPAQFAWVKTWTVVVSEEAVPITFGVVEVLEGEAGLVEVMVGAAGGFESST